MADKYDYNEFLKKNFCLQNMYIEASAGTGKTYNVVETIKKVVKGESGIQIPLEKILVVTYTEKAVGELKSRVFEALGKPAEIYTIHSFCQKMLSLFGFESGQNSDLEMVDENKIDDFIEKLIRDKYSYNDEFRARYEEKCDFIDEFKTVLKNGVAKFCDDSSIIEIDFDSFKNLNIEKNKYFVEKIKETYVAWKKEKEKQHLWSFEDMLDIARAKVCDNDGDNLFAKAIQERYQLAIIDEFQDTNQKQWDIFKMLFLNKAEHNIIVVGDPKQSIYSFQNADVNVYNKALKDITNKNVGKGKGFLLTHNYRSTNEIIDVCNVLFDDNNDFFIKNSTDIKFSASDYPENGKAKKTISFNGKKAPPAWLFNNAKKDNFSKKCTTIIKECCKREKSGKTKLQIFDKNKLTELTDVKYSDFTILYRKRSEAKAIIKELKNANIPYTLAKNDSLFEDREIDMWIAILQSIDVNDFAGFNKKILNRCLHTDFFETNLCELDDVEKVENNIEKIRKWRRIKEDKQWSTLFEEIYVDTKIEKTLSCKKDFVSLGKLRQLSNYIVNYLYRNNCDLNDAIVLLQRIKNEKISIGRDENLIERASDKDAVSLMTIHASKGLQFPVVISLAGCESGRVGVSNRINNKIYTYHKDDKKLYLGFDKSKNEKEQDEELRRLLYVDFTRATSLLILPIFANDENKAGYEGVNAILGEIYNNLSSEKYKNLFIDILELFPDKLEKITKPLQFDDRIEKKEFNFDKWNKENGASIKECVKNLPKTLSRQNSYSSLKQHIEDKVILKDTKGGISFTNSSNMYLQCDKALEDIYKGFEKGARIGTAIHEIFENINFLDFKDKTIKDINSDEALRCLIAKILRRNGYYDVDKNNLLTHCLEIVYNTLNAKFPEIDLNLKTLDTTCFSLRDIDKRKTLSEVQFDALASGVIDDFQKSKIKNYWTGSIDLVFERLIDNKNIYYIIDWKTDTFDNINDYADYDYLKKACDEHYSVQRVLYAYMLVCYLSSAFGITKEKVFRENFGGIYYVFVKGCREGESSGIYPHTWCDFKTLEMAYDNLLRNDDLGV